MDQGLRGVLDVRAIGYYRNLTDGRRELPRKIRTVLRGLYVLSASRRMLNPFRYGLFAFTAAVLGGIGNLAGAVLGGIFIGIVWAMSDGFIKQYIPDWGPQWTTTVIFGLLVLIMVFRPTGLLGAGTTDKV